MDQILSILPALSGPYYYLVGAGCVLAGLYFNDGFSNINPLQYLSKSNGKQNDVRNYGYDDYNGPAFWKTGFPDADSGNQSPINLKTAGSTILNADETPLTWSKEYDVPPAEMVIYNTGHCVVLYTNWCGKRPTLTGGPLEDDTFEFMTLRFRWGPNDFEGSEHMIDDQKYALEMQAAYVKSGFLHDNIVEVIRNNGLVMATDTENPYIEPIIASLRSLRCPSKCMTLHGTTLSLLAPSFSRNYFFYCGSLTFPPCTEGVRWIVQAEPLLISTRQVRKFRKLFGCNMGPLVSNCRPVQLVNDREVGFYC